MTFLAFTPDVVTGQEPMLTTYNLPMLGNPQAHLQHLIHTGTLRSVPKTPSGCTGASYALQVADGWQAVDAFGAELGGVLIQTNLFRLPTAAFQALVSSSARFRQHDLRALSQALQAGHVDRTSWWTHLAETVSRGPHLTQATGHLSSPLLQQARWIPEETVFSITPQGRWMTTLAFEVQTHLPGSVRETAIGIDVGLQPLAACAGHASEASYPTTILRASEHRLESMFKDQRFRHLARRLHHLLIYSEARRQWERLLAEQLPHASVVCVERLSLPEMQAQFRWASTELGIADFLLSWLPQHCREMGIPLVRVQAAFTSRLCAKCFQRGQRPGHGDVFTCPVHGDMNAHVNAAQVIRSVGLATLLADACSKASWAQGEKP